MIIAIGYRVRSHRGTQFRQWATERLNEYLVKGFTMDDDRLKEMRNFGQDYFDELLKRIRDIRASEGRFYLRLLTYMLPQLIMIRKQNSHRNSLQLYKINCTLLYMGTLHQS